MLKTGDLEVVKAIELSRTDFKSAREFLRSAVTAMKATEKIDPSIAERAEDMAARLKKWDDCAAFLDKAKEHLERHSGRFGIIASKRGKRFNAPLLDILAEKGAFKKYPIQDHETLEFVDSWGERLLEGLEPVQVEAMRKVVGDLLVGAAIQCVPYVNRDWSVEDKRNMARRCLEIVGEAGRFSDDKALLNMMVLDMDGMQMNPEGSRSAWNI